ncbi:dual specificity protein kinase splA isoform X1 [Musca domestica]|uniref:Dual specificity protein kinase splA isoform X1 n=1 Tax=Musca domestica TaxID=7370 RepID=A0A9J7DCY3_MUSDO|nr:dual specificity protein kinase splA isoform X1 [Musca domestica]
MAAKPPKPPGNFLKNPNNNNSINHNNNNDNNCNNTNNNTCETNSSRNNNNNHANSNGDDSLAAAIANTCNAHSPTTGKKSTCNCTNITIMHLFHEMKQEFPTIPDNIVTQCVNENCHQREQCIRMLRNELELNPIPVQSYPAKVLHPPNTNSNNGNLQYNNVGTASTTTTPTPTAAPTPTTVNVKPPLQQKPIVQQKPPLKPPLKPIRPAPLQPPPNKPNSPLLQRNVSLPVDNSNYPARRHPLNKQITISGVEYLETATTGGVAATALDGDDAINEMKLNDMPTTKTPVIQKREQEHQTSVSSPHKELNNNSNNNGNNGCIESNSCIGETTPAAGAAVNTPQPRARPTTLNLNSQQQQQQQQRQRLNVQLQEHSLQQRHKQQQQQPTTATTTKPVRKAPLPPIAPKPNSLTSTQPQHHHANPPFNSGNNNNNNTTTAGDSLSTHTASSSPLSESEISVNVSISTPPSPTSSTSSSSKTHHQHNSSPQNKSPIRHRSVITLQPEPPYTRDFFQQTTTFATTPGGTTAPLTPTTTTAFNSSSSVVSSPTNSGNSQKSYTSVNLTLRPPTTVLNSALQPSAIDITAGPGFSGASGGGKHLSYSSTSYDARLGYQQNFHITVTDEGGVFSASRRRPQRIAGQQQQVNICENQYDGNSDGDDKCNHVNSLYAEQQQQIQQLQSKQYSKQLQQQHQQQFHNNNSKALIELQQPQQQHRNNPNNLKSPQGIGSGDFGSMCLAPQQAEDEIVAEVLERQKKRRDKLAAALRENKKRLGQVEQEVNLITGTIPDGLAERLDTEIQRLRSECQAMLRSSNPMANQHRPPPQQQQQQTPQPFPRQRCVRPPARPPPPRQTSLDIIQHHSTTTPTTPHTPASLPNFNNSTLSSSTTSLLGPSFTHQQYQHSHSLSPSIYSQQQLQQQQQQQSPLSYQPPPTASHHSDFIPSSSSSSGTYNGLIDSDTDNGDYDDDDDEEQIEHWECSMCTFRNHPQLNICECCDNVRILPGTLQNLSRAMSTNSACSEAGAAAVANRSVTNVNALRSASGTSLNSNASANATAAAAGGASRSGNLEHDTNLAQQQLQHFALHT